MAGHGLRLDERQFVIVPGKSLCRMEYHEKLNVILVGTEDGNIFVLDSNLGDVLYNAKIAETGQGWDFSISSDRVAVVTNERIGIRSDYNGILLLDSILQVPVTTFTETVEIELNKTEAELLYQSFAVENVKGQDPETIEFLKHLKSILAKRKEVEPKQDPSTFSVKREKWSTVKLNCRHSSLKRILQGVVNELLRRNHYNPQLSIASSILERLNSLLSHDFESQAHLDKGQMFSELVRLNTFLNWPHRDYKWAHPTKMAQAGFYHSPSTTGEDRAMCFTCKVCLVSWEPTDEPWSEHERHSPFCPFVRGEHTHNVPLTLTYATAPAFKDIKNRNSTETPILGKSSCQNAFPLCYPSGLVVVWDTLKQTKEAVRFEVSLMDLEDSDPLAVPGYSDIDIKPKEAWVDCITSTNPLTVTRADFLEAMDLTSSISLCRVALISSGQCPPSVVVAGGTLSGSDEWLNSWILVYGLSATTFTAEDVFSSSECYEMDGSGTKQDSTQFEDELFGPYTLSESDLIPEYVTLVDTNVPDNFFLNLDQALPTVASNASETSFKTVFLSNAAGAQEPSSEKPKADTQQSKVILIQKLAFPEEIQHCVVKLLEITPDKSKIIVIVGSDQNQGKFQGATLVFNVTCDSDIVGLDPQPAATKLIDDEREVPIASCFVPSETEKVLIACVLVGGSLKIYSLTDLSCRFFVSNNLTELKFTSVAYCSSIERLLCGTDKGFLNLYSTGLNDSDDDNQNQVDESMSEVPGMTTGSQADLILNKPLNTASLQQLLQLTKFENVKLPFSVNAPSCWQRVVQAQKERKHPQHLHHEAELSQSSVSWRLQRSKDSRKEHLFEITFPKTANVGHFDIKFAFQLGCTSLPPIEVTLYMARNAHNKRGSSSQVDRGIDFGSQIPNRSSEFLKLTNAEVVCGPLNLGTHVDLSSQGGTLVMTSPLLLLSRGRNFFLHLKAKSLGKEKAGNAEDPTSPTKKKISKSREHKFKSSSSNSHKKSGSYHPFTKGSFMKTFSKDSSPFLYSQAKSLSRNTLMEEIERRKDLEGCDWLHEVSITVRQIKESPLPNSELERKAMLTSPEFVRRLLQVVTFGGTEVSYAAQSIALDLLTWIAAIKLCGPQLQGSSYQLDFVEAIQYNLSGLLLKCILLTERSTAHKCAKLLVLCIDVAEVYHNKEGGFLFLQNLLQSLLLLLPYAVQCTSAGALQWYFLLLNRVRNVDPSLASETMLNLLSKLSKELITRTDPLHAILRTRFGLYGIPFEPDLFDIELPPFTRAHAPPMTYAGLCGENGGNAGMTSSVVHLSGLKDVDFRDLLLGNPVRKEKISIVSPKQQIHGLLEVEPLHFSCHASSDGARIEKIDSGGTPSFSPLPIPQHWEPFTNMPTGEGSKKSEPEKTDQVMLLQNLSKLNAIKMDHMESYYDYLNDIKLLEGNLNLIDMIAFQPNHSSESSANAQGTGTDLTETNYATYLPATMSTPMSVGQHDNNLHSLTSSSNLKSKSGLQDTSSKVTLCKKAALALAQKPVVLISGPSSSKGDESLRLLISPWQQMMYVPSQQALVIDRMHSGARRYVVLDFAGPILLTDVVIPTCAELASLSIDIWLNREETDGQRLVVASDIAVRSLIINDLQPPPICRYLKITIIGRYGMGTTKCKIPIGMFYGHSAVLPNDLKIGGTEPELDVPMLSLSNIQAHVSILGYVLEDLGCRYQLACGKLKRLLEPLAKPEIASIDHIAYYLPKGKERNKLGLNCQSDQTILSSYQDCITLQQQLNVTKNVIGRLQRSLEPYAAIEEMENPMTLLQKISSDKVRLLSTFLVESLLGISYMASTKISETIPYPLYADMTQSACADLFQNICVMENGQCQLSACTFLLRVCGFQPWWGNFLSTTLKTLFCSSNTSVFPQDRVFTLLVYLGQKMLFSGPKSFVLESTMKLMEEILCSADEKMIGFTRSKIDMSLLGWTVMYLCLCLDGVSQSILNISGKNEGRKSKDSNKNATVSSISSRWHFIQGESVLHNSLTDNLKSSNSSGMKRRIPKKSSAVKQKLDEITNAASTLGFNASESLAAKFENALASKLTFTQKVNFNKHSNTAAQLVKNHSTAVNSAKNLKELLLSRRSDGSTRAFGSSKGKEGCEISDIGINLNLNPGLCYTVTKALGSFLLKMDSTCHSDMYLLLCKALARIATSCRPAMRLGDIFTEEQIVSLIQTAVGNDYVRQVNWSSSWISHAIMCLILDILEGERLFPEADKSSEKTPLIENESMGAFLEESAPSNSQAAKESIPMDVTDTENEGTNTFGQYSGNMITSTFSVDSESDYEILEEYAPFSELDIKVSRSPRQMLTSKELTASTSSLSTALDSRLENGIESSTELRLRMMGALESELLAQSLTAPIEVPPEILRNVKSRTCSSSRTEDPIHFTGLNSVDLLSSCFNKLFLMMASENCCTNIEKVLLFWLSVNLDMTETEDIVNIKPSVPLSSDAVKGLIRSLTRNVGVGVQDWGLGFKCLSLVANQNESGMYLSIITDSFFPDMILKFISGTGMNLQRNNVPAMGPGVCEDFLTFLSRIFLLGQGTSWTSYTVDVLLRILSEFLSGAFLGSEFPQDAFNKFLDILLSFVVQMPKFNLNPAILVSIVDHFSHALYLYVFFPNKIVVKSNAELKGAPPATTATGIPLTPGMSETLRKPQNLETLLIRLLSLVTTIVTFTYREFKGTDVQTSMLNKILLPKDLDYYKEVIAKHVANKEPAEVKTIADIVVHMDATMLRILSVLANPNGRSLFNEEEISPPSNSKSDQEPTTIVDFVIRLISQFMVVLSEPKEIVRPLFNFLRKSPYEDFCCPLIVSQMFVVTVLKVIKEEGNLLEFVNFNCIESICNKLVASSRQFFSSCPTFVSIMMQYIGRADSAVLFGQRRYGNEATELPGGIINVAPLETLMHFALRIKSLDIGVCLETSEKSPTVTLQSLLRQIHAQQPNLYLLLP